MTCSMSQRRRNRFKTVSKLFQNRFMKQQRLEKLNDIPLLLDVYGGLLTERQREALSLTYEEDCSLAEIAALHGSSRQAVHDLIERGEAQLRQYEAGLHLLEESRRRSDLIDELRSRLSAIPMEAEERLATEELLCRL